MQYEDRIHGRTTIPRPFSLIIECPQFERLKHIKQLGLLDKTMPEANTTRYEHCIGTYILAGKMLDSLQNKDPSLQISELHKTAVEMAALLHDIGHGPFSHTWENVCGKQYHHESNCRHCIDEIFNVDERIEWAGDLRVYAIELIKCLIEGKRDNYEGIGYLFEIVNNKQCDIDVDKWDYLQRDFLYAKEYTRAVPLDMDFEDVFMNARVNIEREHIEYRYKDFQKIYNIFDARQTFHICFYRRPYVVCLENIFKEILDKSDVWLKLDERNLREIRSCHTATFLRLTDAEIWKILDTLRSFPSSEIWKLVLCLKGANIMEVYNQDGVPQYLTVNICIPYAGEVIKSDKILFYGNKTDKPTFVQKMGYHLSVSYFKIRE